MIVNSENLVKEVSLAKKTGRSDLLCSHCAHVKSFMSIDGYWNHFVNKHFEVDDVIRLEEIIQSGLLWLSYWQHHSHGGKRGNKTQARLEQIQQAGFCWQNVEHWDFRNH